MRKSILLIFTVISCGVKSPTEKVFDKGIEKLYNSPFYVRNAVFVCLYHKDTKEAKISCFEAIERQGWCAHVELVMDDVYCYRHAGVCRYLEEKCQILIQPEDSVPKKLERCVKQVKKQGKDSSTAWAICKDTLNSSKKKKRK